MDHVERLLEVRELRAIVCVVRAVVDCEGADAGRVAATLLVSSLCGGRASQKLRVSQGKCQSRRQVALPWVGVRVRKKKEGRRRAGVIWRAVLDHSK
jgi:hypothetical protein